jgi:hypothetical protein
MMFQHRYGIVSGLCFSIHLNEEGRAVLAGMETASSGASDSSYDLVRRYVASFEREVRKVETL